MKQNIQPKVKTGLRMSTTMKVVAGTGILATVLTIAFFIYSNLTHKDSLANNTQITSILNNNWSHNPTWDLNRQPINGDIVIIPAGITVTVASPVHFNGTVKVYGTLRFTNGKLFMDSTSQVMLHENGILISNGPGTSDKITIGSYSWTGSSISNITGPNLLTYNGAVGGNPLPVKLIAFKAAKEGNHVKLLWSTAMEVNNDYFSIERSTDGQQFENVGRVTGAGNASEKMDYEFIDEAPVAGINYYRLKQIDYDGKYEYSNIIRLDNKISTAMELISAGPNPFKDNFTVEFNGETEGEAEIFITNVSGAVIHQEKININSGNNKYQFSDNKNLPNGIYFITIQNDQQKLSQKLIKG